MPRADQLPQAPFDVLDPANAGPVRVPAELVAQLWGDEDPDPLSDDDAKKRYHKWLNFYGRLKPVDQEILKSRMGATLLEDQPARLRTYRGLSHEGLMNGLLDTFMAGEQPGVWAAEAGGHAVAQLREGVFQPDKQLSVGGAYKAMAHDVLTAFMPGWLELAAQKLGLMKRGRGIYGFGTVAATLADIPRPDTMPRAQREALDRAIKMTRASHVVSSVADAWFQAPWDIMERQVSATTPAGMEQGLQKVFPHALGENVSQYATYEQAFFRPYLPYWSAVGGREAGLPESMVNSPELAAQWLMEHDEDESWPLMTKLLRMTGAVNKKEADWLTHDQGFAGKLTRLQSTAARLMLAGPGGLLIGSAGSPMVLDIDRGDVTGLAADLALDLAWFVPVDEAVKGVRLFGGKGLDKATNLLNRMVSHGEGGLLKLVEKSPGKWEPVNPLAYRLLNDWQTAIQSALRRYKDFAARQIHLGLGRANPVFGGASGQDAIDAVTGSWAEMNHQNTLQIDELMGMQKDGLEKLAAEVDGLLPERADKAARAASETNLLERINEARPVARHTREAAPAMKSLRRGDSNEYANIVARVTDLTQDFRDRGMLFSRIMLDDTHREILEGIAKSEGANPRLANLGKLTEQLVHTEIDQFGKMQVVFDPEWMQYGPSTLKRMGRETEKRVARALADRPIPVDELGNPNFIRHGAQELLTDEDWLDIVNKGFVASARDAMMGDAGAAARQLQRAQKLKQTMGKVVPDAEKLGRYDAWLAAIHYDNPEQLEQLAGNLYALQHADEMAARVSAHWQSLMNGLERDAGKDIRGLVEATSSRMTAAQERIAEMAEQSGLFPVGENGMSYVRQVLSQVHSYRAFEAFHNPKEWAKAAELFDPVLAAEMDAKAAEHQQGAMRALGVSMADPTIERKLVGGWYERTKAEVEAGLQQLETTKIETGDMIERYGRMTAIVSEQLGFMGTSSRAARRKTMDAMAKAWGMSREEIARYVGFSADKKGVAEFEEFALRYKAEDPTAWVVRMHEQYGERAGDMIDRLDQVQWLTRIMPNNQYYGALAGQRVPVEMAAVLKHGPGTVHRASGSAAGLYLKGVQMWKTGKVILNPAAQVRNMISNAMLIYNEMGIKGLNPGHMVGALQDLAKGEGVAPLMRKYTDILDTTWAKSEAGGWAKTFDLMLEADSRFSRISDIYHGVTGAMGRAYQFEEVWGKATVFRAVYPEKLKEAMAAGHTGEEAIKLAATQAGEVAKRVLFDYQKVPPFINWLRGWGVLPFITFPYKAIPRTLLSAIEHPARFGTWPKLFQAIGDLDERRESFDRELPEWMRGNYLRLPIHGSKGESAGYYDLTYTVPWGDFLEQGSIFMNRRDPTAGGGAFPINVPLAQWLVETATGEDYLTGQRLYDWGEMKHNKRVHEVVAGRLYSYLLPPIIFGSSATLDLPRSLMVHEGRPGAERFMSNLLRIGADKETYRRRIEKSWVLRESIHPRSEQGTLTSAILGGFFGLRARSFDRPKEQANRIRNMKGELAKADMRIRQAQRDYEAHPGPAAMERYRDVMERELAVKREVMEAWHEREYSSLLPPSERVHWGGVR